MSRVPLFRSFANRACSVSVASVSPFAVFPHSFLLLVLIHSKASGRPFSLGRAEVWSSRHPHFWRIPFFPIWAESYSAIFESHSLPFFFPVLVPRGPFAVCAMRGSSHFLFFFFSCLLSTDLSHSSSLFVLEGIWGSLLLFILPWSLFFFLGCFFLFWASGSSGPSFYPPWIIRTCYFGLSLDSFFWAWLALPFLLGLFYYDPFFLDLNI